MRNRRNHRSWKSETIKPGTAVGVGRFTLARGRRAVAVVVAISATSLLLAACGGNGETRATLPSATGPITQIEPLAKPVKVRLALTGSQALTLPLWLAVDRGYFEQVGLDVEIQHYKGSTDALLPSLATGRLDIAPATPSPALYNQLAEKFDIRVIASLGEGKEDRIQSAWLTVLKDQAGFITKLSDLKGKRVEGAREGSPPAMLVSMALEAGGLTANDVKLTYHVQQPPEMVAIARARGADVIGMSEPLATQAKKLGLVTKWKGAAELMPWFQAGLLASSPQFLKSNPEAASKFLAAYLVACREINATNGTWTPELKDLVRKNFDSAPDDVAAQGGVPYFNPDGTIKTKSLERVQHLYVSSKVLRAAVDVKRLTSTTALNGAVNEVGDK